MPARRRYNAVTRFESVSVTPPRVAHPSPHAPSHLTGHTPLSCRTGAPRLTEHRPTLACTRRAAHGEENPERGRPGGWMRHARLREPRGAVLAGGGRAHAAIWSRCRHVERRGAALRHALRLRALPGRHAGPAAPRRHVGSSRVPRHIGRGRRIDVLASCLSRGETAHREVAADPAVGAPHRRGRSAGPVADGRLR